eukprot:Skav209059  [mRNA]  locus=scaffold760:170830:171105:+ [translate_table: standard]
MSAAKLTRFEDLCFHNFFDNTAQGVQIQPGIDKGRALSTELQGQWCQGLCTSCSHKLRNLSTTCELQVIGSFINEAFNHLLSTFFHPNVAT